MQIIFNYLSKQSTLDFIFDNLWKGSTQLLSEKIRFTHVGSVEPLNSLKKFKLDGLMIKFSLLNTKHKSYKYCLIFLPNNISLNTGPFQSSSSTFRLMNFSNFPFHNSNISLNADLLT